MRQRIRRQHGTKNLSQRLLSTPRPASFPHKLWPCHLLPCTPEECGTGTSSCGWTSATPPASRFLNFSQLKSPHILSPGSSSLSISHRRLLIFSGLRLNGPPLSSDWKCSIVLLILGIARLYFLPIWCESVSHFFKAYFPSIGEYKLLTCCLSYLLCSHFDFLCHEVPLHILCSFLYLVVCHFLIDL